MRAGNVLSSPDVLSVIVTDSAVPPIAIFHTFSHKLPHPIYLAMAFLGHLEPVAAYAKKLGNYDWMAADELRVILEGERGLGMIILSCNWPKDTAMLDIFGTKRNLHIRTGERKTGFSTSSWHSIYRVEHLLKKASLRPLCPHPRVH